jgi:hypothetical protein
MITMFEDWLGKRVILWVTAPNRINYVGTLSGCEGVLVKLTKVTPQRESRSMPDMIANLSSSEYSSLTLVTDPKEDPTGGK